MKKVKLLASIASCAVMTTAGAASAKVVVLQVDARSGPWAPAVNKNLPYGDGTQAPAVLLSGLGEQAGNKLSIYADGETSIPGHDKIKPAGLAGSGVDDTFGAHKKRYPSFYTPKILYPAFRHALVATFVAKDGGIVGRPFIVGDGARVAVPDGAASLSLGFNDVEFGKNSGSLKVSVEMPDE